MTYQLSNNLSSAHDESRITSSSDVSINPSDIEQTSLDNQASADLSSSSINFSSSNQTDETVTFAQLFEQGTRDFTQILRDNPDNQDLLDQCFSKLKFKDSYKNTKDTNVDYESNYRYINNKLKIYLDYLRGSRDQMSNPQNNASMNWKVIDRRDYLIALDLKSVNSRLKYEDIRRAIDQGNLFFITDTQQQYEIGETFTLAESEFRELKANIEIITKQVIHENFILSLTELPTDDHKLVLKVDQRYYVVNFSEYDDESVWLQLSISNMLDSDGNKISEQKAHKLLDQNFAHINDRSNFVQFSYFKEYVNRFSICYYENKEKFKTVEDFKNFHQELVQKAKSLGFYDKTNSQNLQRSLSHTKCSVCDCYHADKNLYQQYATYILDHNFKFKVLDIDVDNYQIKIKTDNRKINIKNLTSESTFINVAPDTHTVDSQINSIKNLLNTKHPEHQPLINLFLPHSQVEWPQFCKDIKIIPPTQNTQYKTSKKEVRIKDFEEQVGKIGNSFKNIKSNPNPILLPKYDDWYVIKDFGYKGSDQQVKFVLKALNTPDFVLLDGPPGSGKTTAIIELICQLIKQGKRVLLVASTHVAVDNVLERILSDAKLRQHVVPLRIGLEENVSVNTASYTLNNFINTECEHLLGVFEKIGEENLSPAQLEMLELIRVANNYNNNQQFSDLDDDNDTNINNYSDASENLDLDQDTVNSLEAQVDFQVSSLDLEANSELEATTTNANENAEQEQDDNLGSQASVTSDIVTELQSNSTYVVGNVVINLQPSDPTDTTSNYQAEFLSKLDSNDQGLVKDKISIIRTPAEASPSNQTSKLAHTKSFHNQKQELRNLTEQILDHANLICGTTIGILQYYQIKNLRNSRDIKPVFDMLILDEASKTTFQEFLVPAIYARRWAIIGDPKQLSPYAEEEEISFNVDTTLESKVLKEVCYDIFSVAKKEKKHDSKQLIIYVDPQYDQDDKIESFIQDYQIQADYVNKIIEENNLSQFYSHVLVGSPSDIGNYKDFYDLSTKTLSIKHTPEVITKVLDKFNIIILDDYQFYQSLKQANLNTEKFQVANRKFYEYTPLLFNQASRHDGKAETMVINSSPRNMASNYSLFSMEADQRVDESSNYNNMGRIVTSSKWALEISWRLIMQYQQRIINDENVNTSTVKNNTHYRRYNQEINMLLPVNKQDCEFKIKNEIKRIFFPSILETLRLGFKEGQGIKNYYTTTFDDGFDQQALQLRMEKLTNQHRMHKDIAAFPSKYIYNNKALVTDTSNDSKKDRKWTYEVKDGKRVKWIQVEKDKFETNRYINNNEADRILEDLDKFVQWNRQQNLVTNNPPSYSVAILTFYNEQRHLINEKLCEYTHTKRNQYFTIDNINIEVCTVDKFQGNEADYVLLSFTCDYPTAFIDNMNRLNVALTRARQLLKLYGDCRYGYLFKNTDSILSKLIKEHKDYAEISSVSTAK